MPQTADVGKGFRFAPTSGNREALRSSLMIESSQQLTLLAGYFSAQFIPNTKQRAEVLQVTSTGARKTHGIAEIRATGWYLIQHDAYVPVA